MCRSLPRSVPWDVDTNTGSEKADDFDHVIYLKEEERRDINKLI